MAARAGAGNGAHERKSERVTESWECDKACTSKAKGRKRGERIKWDVRDTRECVVRREEGKAK